MRYGYPFAILVLVVSVLFVLVAWDHARQRELRLASEQFRGIAGQQASLVQMHLNNIEVTLRGGVSLFAAVDQPTPEQWRGYVDGLRVQSRFPYVLGLGYAVYVDGRELTRLQEAWREDGRGLLGGHRRKQTFIELLRRHGSLCDPLDDLRVFEVLDRGHLLADLRQDDVEDGLGQPDLFGLVILEWGRGRRLESGRGDCYAIPDR